MALPNAACQWLSEATGHHYWATAHSVLPRWLPAQQQTKQKIQNVLTLMAVLMAMVGWCVGTIPSASPNGGGPGVS